MRYVIIPYKLLMIFLDIMKQAENELVGFLIGSKVGDVIIINELILCENEDESPYSFKAYPHAVLKAYEIAESYGLDVIAIIHSHPGPPYPSIKDLSGMKLWGIPWIIVDMLSHEVRAWELHGGEIMELELILTSNSIINS